jgi:hypothetical protein
MYDQEVSAMPPGQRAVVSSRRGSVGLRGTADGYPSGVLGRLLHRAGLRSWQLQGTSLGSIGLCLGLWIRAKTVDQDERGNAERRALFVGLWPPMFWLIGSAVEQHERSRRGRR